MNSQPKPLQPQFIHPEVAKISDCPCSPSAAFDNGNYRAVHQNIYHPDNFLPKAVLEPDYLTGASPRKSCGAWGLSMFDSPANLNAMVLKVEATVPGFRKKIGEYAAKMNLDSTHGVRTAANKKGHFDFYAYVTCDYLAQVVEVKAY